MAGPDPAALQARIITHMNADHAFSLTLYARHYNHLPQHMACTARLESLTLTHLTMTSSFGRLLVPFSPPLTSLTQAREKLVAMHADCLAVLDVADVRVAQYRPPNAWWQWAAALGVTAVLLTFPFRASLLPESGSWAAGFWSLGGRAPWLARLAWVMQPVTLPATLLIHVLEVRHLVVGRLRRFSVQMFSAVWWCWVVDVFLEGFGAFMRFDQVVTELREAKGLQTMEVKGQKARELRDRRGAAAGAHEGT